MNKKADFNKTATDGFSIQSAIKRSILKQQNMNETHTSFTSSTQVPNKSERTTGHSATRSMHQTT